MNDRRIFDYKDTQPVDVMAMFARFNATRHRVAMVQRAEAMDQRWRIQDNRHRVCEMVWDEVNKMTSFDMRQVLRDAGYR